MNKYSLLTAATLIFFTASAQAGVIIGGTRIIYNGDKKETSISVKNPYKSSYLIQSWSDAGEKSSDKSPFMVTPPLFRLDAGQENNLRIIRTGGNLPEDRESLYWMNIKSIPSTTEKQDNVNTLQIAVKTRIKLIYRPQSLAGQRQSPDREQPHRLLYEFQHGESRHQYGKRCHLCGADEFREL